MIINVNKTICNYIASEWIAKSTSNRRFAIEHNIDEKIVRKIVKQEGYRIPVKTLFEICDSRNLLLSSFFKLIGV